MLEEAWVGNGSDSSLIHIGKRLLKLLIHKNNDNTDETSIVGNLLFFCLNVFHVPDKAFPVVLHFKENRRLLLLGLMEVCYQC